MIRTTSNTTSLDGLLVNGSTSKSYSVIKDSILTTPDLSCKAKVIISILMTNKNKWSNYREYLQSVLQEGINAIDNAIAELNQMGYVKHIKFRDIITKQIKGSFIVYTDEPGNFDFSRYLDSLKSKGYEIISQTHENHAYGKKDQRTKEKKNERTENKEKKEKEKLIKEKEIKENKEKKERNKRKLENVLYGARETFSENNEFFQIAERLSKIIQTRKNITHSKNQLNSWSVEITAMSQRDHISPERINAALDWYSTFIGGEYVPVIESGRSLREKFSKLENAIERSEKYKTNMNTQNKVGYLPANIKFTKPSIKM